MVATIPFDFTVNNLTLPAGEYAVWETTQGAHAIGNTDGNRRALSITYRVAANPERLAKLVFRKYGDKYFLAEAWNSLREPVMAFGKCRKEKELVTSRLVSGIRVDQVVVLARVR
ncbi:MAG: hypothetical protein JNN08_14220 [Bryobacterales bacterium]|nr:hypothetical protein [Bryobacterales bacterium]